MITLNATIAEAGILTVCCRADLFFFGFKSDVKAPYLLRV